MPTFMPPDQETEMSQRELHNETLTFGFMVYEASRERDFAGSLPNISEGLVNSTSSSIPVHHFDSAFLPIE